jgi:RNA polymerase subunit RPABC4/transcription elongation factor Spt4
MSDKTVQCPICDNKFGANLKGALVILRGWLGMDVIRCPKCLKREHKP